MLEILEETELWNQFAATRSPLIREQLVLQSVPLVHFLLSRLGIHRDIGPDYEDLVHQGLLGLIDAVDRFDPQLGTRFSTFASIRVRGKIIDYLRSGDWMSRSCRRRVRNVQKGMSNFWLEHHRAPSDEELAAFIGMELTETQQGLADSAVTFVSLDRIVDEGDEESTSFYDTQADETQMDPFDICTEAARKTQLVSAIKQLSEREQLVLSMYYFEALNFKEIGKVMDVSESRVCQIHARAIMNIKVLLNNE